MNVHIMMMLILVVVLHQMNPAFRMMDDQVKNAFKDLNTLQCSIVCTLPVLFMLIMSCGN